MMNLEKYRIRKNILKALNEYKVPCCVDDIIDYPGFYPFMNGKSEAIKAEWENLRKLGFIDAVTGFEGKYCIISEKGFNQLQVEYKKDPFIYGPSAM